MALETPLNYAKGAGDVSRIGLRKAGQHGEGLLLVDVITPVISDFTTTPMIADMLKPLFRGPSIHMREALFHGVHSKHRNGASVQPDVGLFYLLKKGERYSVFRSAFFCPEAL